MQLRLSYLVLLFFACALTSVGTYKVYWNVPSRKCLNRGIDINLDPYGIIYNKGHRFQGDKIRILYRPGHYPYVKPDGSYENNAIPQRGDLNYHLNALADDVKRVLPDDGDSGIAVLDFEKWKPSFNDSPRIYREKSWKYAKESHDGPLTWPETLRRSEKQFEEAAAKYLGGSLVTASQARPQAQWGYYQYPLCGNYQSPDNPCPVDAKEELARYGWLYEKSQALYPSIYLFKNNTSLQRYRRVSHHFDKVQGVAGNKPVYPYTWFQYHSSQDELLDQVDLLTSLGEPLARNFAGAIVWGSTYNVNTRKRCLQLKQYLENRLGPLIRHLIDLPPSERSVLAREIKTYEGRQRLIKSIRWS